MHIVLSLIIKTFTIVIKASLNINKLILREIYPNEVNKTNNYLKHIQFTLPAFQNIEETPSLYKSKV